MGRQMKIKLVWQRRARLRSLELSEGVYQGPLKPNGWLTGGDAYKYGFAAMVLILNMAGGKENEYVSESSQTT